MNGMPPHKTQESKTTKFISERGEMQGLQYDQKAHWYATIPYALPPTEHLQTARCYYPVTTDRIPRQYTLPMTVNLEE